MSKSQSADSYGNVLPTQEPTTSTVGDSMPQMPTTPPRLITATLDSPMSSTISSPEIVHETQLRNVFDESGTIEDVRQRNAESQSVDKDEDEDEDEGVDLSDSDGRSEQDQVDNQSLIEIDAKPNDTAQTQGIDSRPYVAKAKLTARLFNKYELDDMLKKQDFDGTNSTRRLQCSRASSTPPEPHSSKEPQLFGRKSNFVHRFDHEHLPPPTLPLHMEILTYIRRWGPWVAQIADYETRMSLIHHITEKMRKVWGDGIKQGLIPKKAPEGQQTMSPTELQAAMEKQRGREAERKKQKRQLSPSKAVVIDVRRKFHSDKFPRTDPPITAGELHEAGVKWQNVQDRISTGRLDPEGVLIAKIAERLGRNTLAPDQDWKGKVHATKNNTTGRNLLMFCLWSVFRCDSQLEYLKNMLDMAQTDRETLETEQKLRDQLMAVALELDSEDEEEEDEEDNEEEASSDEDETPQHVPAKVKRVIELSPEPPAKRTKREGSLASNSTPDVDGSPKAEELLTVLPLEFTNLDVFRKQVAFIGNEIRPKANALLQAAGEELETIDESIERWGPVSTRLQESGIAWGRINELIMEINARFSDIKVEDKREKEQEDVVRDIEGLPSRLEIWHTIPPEGLTNSELQEAFPEVTPSNPAWQKLVKSVAKYEKKASRWLPLKHFPDHEAQASQLDAGSRPTLKIVLKVKGVPGYKPGDYSPETINHTRGFKWRYMSSSTIQQRMSMDEVVEEYVNERIAVDSPKNRVKGVPHQHRRGQYIVLGHPDFPNDPGVVHGIWEMRKNTDTEDPSLIWFYDGGDREVVDFGFASYEPVPQGTMEEMEQLIQNRKTAQIQQEHDAQAGRGSEQTAASQAPPAEALDTPKSDQSGRVGKGGRGGRGGARGAKRGGRGGGRVSKTKGSKRKMVEESSDDDAPRPRRKAAKVVAYDEGDGGDEGDEYIPED